jgi:hypothetical protein
MCGSVPDIVLSSSPDGMALPTALIAVRVTSLGKHR